VKKADKGAAAFGGKMARFGDERRRRRECAHVHDRRSRFEIVRRPNASSKRNRLQASIMSVARNFAPAVWLAASICTGANAEDNKTVGAAPFQGVSAREFHVKSGYCETCHGLSARGFVGTTPMPRLAGQQPAYIKNQLEAFIEHRRLNPVMGNVAHVLSPAMVEALATHFKDLDPPPYGGAPQDLVAAGEKIYKEGVPEAEIPACNLCHGDDGHGQDEIPRLAGQLDGYVINKLTNWPKERGQDPKKSDNSEIMAPFAAKLTRDQIAAVAAYLSYLK
jgi:cytochrome c553